MLTKDEFKQALPDKFRLNVTNELVDRVNAILADPDICDTYRENFISYAHVLQSGKFKIQNYIDAVKYVSFRLMNYKQTKAYSLAFPEKIADWQARGVSDKDMSSYITAYNKSKLVTELYAQTLIPTSILNQDLHQEALKTQADLMRTAKSEMVQHLAAKTILEMTKPPETQKVELSLGEKQGNHIDALREATMALVAQQRAAIQAGAMNAQDAAHCRVIEAERVE